MQSRQTTGSRDRGIGRYSLSLARAMLEVGSRHEFLIVANAELGALDDVRRDFGLGTRSKELKVFSALSRASSDLPENAWRRKASELIRESYLNTLGADFVHTTSLFEGFKDAACSSVKSGACGFSQAATLYDLIPYVFREAYLTSPEVRAWYYEKVGHLRRADLLLAISDFSARDAVSQLGLNDTVVVNISGAADPHFLPTQIGLDESASVLARYGLGKFLMYTGGIDHRKNVDALIRAYSRLPATLVQQVQLAIVCKVTPGDRARLAQLIRSLGLATDRVVITGFVPEADLVTLCNLCEAFVFPSWYEGFGLPVLEAMQCGAAVIAADASSLPEIVGRKDALFDPFSEAAISEKMRQVLEDLPFRRDLQAHGVERARQFTWHDSARRAIEAMEEVHAVNVPRRQISLGRAPGDERPTLAFVSPLPPERSGIADYSRDLLPFLEKHYRITLVNVSGVTDDPYLCANMPVRDVDWLRRHSDRFDRIIYQFGNSTFHSHMFDLLDEIPGVVVLHDFWLSGIISNLDFHGELPGFWNEALHMSHGWRAVLDRQLLEYEPAVAKWPTSGSVVHVATGIIVHSQRSRGLLLEHYGQASQDKSCVIPLVRIVPPMVDKAESVRKLGYSADTRLICVFGFIHETKYSLEIVEAFLQSSLAAEPNVRLVMVGDIVGGEQRPLGQALLRHMDASNGKVSYTGFVDPVDYALHLEAAEAAIQLRKGSRGETSAAALDCLANRVALIVNCNPAFSEIPQAAVQMLPEDFSGDELVSAIEHVMLCSPERDAQVKAGLDYLRVQCNASGIALSYRDAIESFEASSRRLATVRLCTSIAALDAGVAPSVDDLDSAARAIRHNMPLQQPGKFFLDAAIAGRLGPEAILAAVNGAGEASARVDLVAYDADGFRNARASMSSLLGLSAGLPDARIQPTEESVYLLDLAELIEATGGGQAYASLLDQLDPVGDSIWFFCHSEWLRYAELNVLGSAARVATGFLLEDGQGGRNGFESLELALANAGKAEIELRWAASPDVLGLRDAVRAARGGSMIVSRSSARVWHPGLPEIGSQVGRRQGDTLFSAGQKGFLMFGPYASVPAGRYRLVIYGRAERVPGGAWYDAASGKGLERVLPVTPLSRARPGVLAEAEFHLPESVSDLEVRVWVDEHDEVSLQAFALFDA